MSENRHEKKLYFRKYFKKRRVGLRKKGICLNCGQEKAVKGRRCCPACLLKKRVNDFTRRGMPEVGKIILKNSNRCSACFLPLKKVFVHRRQKERTIHGILCQRCIRVVRAVGNSKPLINAMMIYFYRKP